MIKYYGFSCCTQMGRKCILYTCFWFIYKLIQSGPNFSLQGIVPGPWYFYRYCLAVGALMAGNGSEANRGSPKAERFPVHLCAAPQLKLSPGSTSSPDASDMQMTTLTLKKKKSTVKICSSHTHLCVQALWILNYFGCRSGCDRMHFLLETQLETQLLCLLLVCQFGFTVSLCSLCISGLHLCL